MNKKVLKQLLSLLVALTMMLSFSAVFADSTAKTTDKIVYTSIGDSITAAYGVPEYVEKISTRKILIDYDVLKATAFKDEEGNVVEDTTVADKVSEDSYNELTKDISTEEYTALGYIEQQCYKSKIYDGTPITSSFTYKFASMIGLDPIKQVNYTARPGYRTNEIFMFLDDSEDPYQGDAVGWSLLPALAGVTPDMLQERKDDFYNAVEEADLITIDIGSNNLLLNLMYALGEITASGKSNETLENLKAMLEEYGSMGEVLGQLVSMTETLSQTPEMLQIIMNHLQQAMNDFETYFDKAMGRILEINPDAEIYVVSLYNPIRDAKLFADSNTTIGGIVDPFIRYMNNFLECRSTYRDHYTYVDAFNSEVIAGINLDEIATFSGGSIGIADGFFQKISFNVHPNDEGHTYIAEQLKDAYDGKSLPFTDVDRTNKYYDEIAYCYEHGYMAGTSTHTFAPDMNINRAMFVTTLYAMEGKPSISSYLPFKDVASSSYYSRSVAWAFSKGITAGVNLSLFAPLTSIRRQDMILMLYRYAGSPKVTVNLSEYADANQVSFYAKQAMTWAADNDILLISDGKLSPQSAATRTDLAYALAHYDRIK